MEKGRKKEGFSIKIMKKNVRKMTALMNTGDFIALITILIVLLAGVSALHVIIKDKKK